MRAATGNIHEPVSLTWHRAANQYDKGQMQFALLETLSDQPGRLVALH